MLFFDLLLEIFMSIRYNVIRDFFSPDRRYSDGNEINGEFQVKTHFKRICSIWLCILLTLLYVPAVYADQAPSEETYISISISIRENHENRYFVQPLTLSCLDGTTVAGLFTILEKYAYLENYQMAEGTLLAITLEEEGEFELIGGNGSWLLRINGEDIEANNLPILSDGDRVEWIYFYEGESEDPTDEPLPEVASVNTMALWNDACATALSGACSWLRSNGERITRFVALGAAGVSVEYQDIDNLIKGIAQNQDYEDAAEVAMDILAATFCGIYAGNISGTNLLTTLSNYPDISRGGSYGAILALLAADSNEYSLPADGINTRATLRSVILSAQNEDGGFCLTKGEESSPFLTACALTALSRYSSMDEVRQAVQEGFSYLSSIQQTDGSFAGTEGYSSARTTGAVLTALCAAGISPDSAEFTKNEGNPLDALLRFRTDDGGFSAEIDGASEEWATQQAIMALVSVKGSRSSYVLRTLIQSQSANTTETLENKEPQVTEEPNEQNPDEKITKREHILFGSLGLTIGIALGGIALLTTILIMRRKNREQPKEEQPHED